MANTRFTMSTYLGDGMFVLEQPITKKYFKEALNNLLKQHKQHCDKDEEFYAVYTTRTTRYGAHCTCNIHIFSYGINEIYLREYVLDEGYIFKKLNNKLPYK